MNTEQEKDQATAKACTEDQAGQLWPVPLRRHPRMVYGNPDEFFNDLLMEQNEQQ